MVTFYSAVFARRQLGSWVSFQQFLRDQHGVRCNARIIGEVIRNLGALPRSRRE